MLAHVIAQSKKEDYLTQITAGNNQIYADEPLALGGQDKGFNPYELLCSALASCSVITLNMYTKHKGWEVGEISCEVTLQKQEDSDKVTFLRQVHFENKTLEEKQYQRLLTVVQKCPVHKVLSGEIHIITSLDL